MCCCVANDVHNLVAMRAGDLRTITPVTKQDYGVSSAGAIVTQHEMHAYAAYDMNDANSIGFGCVPMHSSLKYAWCCAADVYKGFSEYVDNIDSSVVATARKLKIVDPLFVSQVKKVMNVVGVVVYKSLTGPSTPPGSKHIGNTRTTKEVKWAVDGTRKAHKHTHTCVLHLMIAHLLIFSCA